MARSLRDLVDPPKVTEPVREAPQPKCSPEILRMGLDMLDHFGGQMVDVKGQWVLQFKEDGDPRGLAAALLTRVLEVNVDVKRVVRSKKSEEDPRQVKVPGTEAPPASPAQA